ncbi:MAG TPA: tryptophan synthase subunit alpha [Clostridia bacterium]|nr:tryptophan synthase subunit alpha [Clostridia bacterium]
MSRIGQVFENLKLKGTGAAFIPYVTVGYPSVDATMEAVSLLEECGAEIIELGVPFSDPMADGLTIQHASHEALRNGITPARCLEVAALLRNRVKLPLVFMTYYNPVLSYGVKRFCADCENAGVDGLIVPDLPPEEAEDLALAACNHGIDLIFLLAPTSTDERIAEVARYSSGFLYLVSVTGVTGARERLPEGLAEFVARVRRFTPLPLCVGFGISSPEHAKEVARVADGVIVGSRIVEIMGSGEGYAPLLSRFARKLKAAVSRSAPV